jgi:2-keto-3-deoxy-L-rhamnonate aldolase RhmA
MSLKEKLARGELALMINPDHPSPSLAETIARLGFDAIFIDCELGMAGPERVQEMCMAARAAGVVPIVRPESNQDWLITRYLAAGAGGVMVPYIETAQDARDLVDVVRNARPADFESRIIIAILESGEALEQLPELLGVDGIDVFFVGPADLAKSMGMPGQKFHPDVQARVFDAARQIVAAGRCAGTLVSLDNAGQYASAGFRLLYEHANAFLALGAQRLKQSAARE